jgi:hypothetical protein
MKDIICLYVIFGNFLDLFTNLEGFGKLPMWEFPMITANESIWQIKAELVEM